MGECFAARDFLKEVLRQAASEARRKEGEALGAEGWRSFACSLEEFEQDINTFLFDKKQLPTGHALLSALLSRFGA